jgi:hypothetical protein
LTESLEKEEGDLEKILLRGMGNLKIGKTKTHSEIFPVTPDTLRQIKIGLSKSKEKLTGQTIWTCSLVAFWGAFRLGELLGKSETKFDKFSDLLWENVVLEGDKATIHIKSPKTGGPNGLLATLYEIPNESFCPVRALKRLNASQKNFGLGEPHLPVFRKTGGRILTKKGFLNEINNILADRSEKLSGKSFRTGLPSALENFPNIFKESHLKALGRWRSRSYQLYMKNDTPEFRWVFQLVANTLLNQNDAQENQNDEPATWTGSWKTPMGKFLPKRKKIPNRTRTRIHGKTTGKIERN